MRLAMVMLAAQFAFTPVPRWPEDPETEVVCAAIRAECPAFAAAQTIETEVGYEELYDADGGLAGVRLTRSSGCAPLDEHVLLSHRKFRMVFHKDGVPDLDGIHLELRQGIDPAAVRIVKAGGTNLSRGCN